MATYVIYSDATDGQIASSSTVYATAQAGSSLSAGTSAVDCYLGQWKNGSTYTIWEAFLSFDTSVIGGGESVDSVTLRITPDDASAGNIGNIEARAVDWGSSLTTADWVAATSLSSLPLRATLATGSLSNGTGADFTSESGFVTNTANPVRLVLCTAQVAAGTTPTTYQGAAFYSADQSGTTSDPKLTIVTTVVTAKSASDTIGVSDSGAQDLTLVGPGSTTTIVSSAFTGTNGTLLNTYDTAWSRLSGTGELLEIQSNKLTVRNNGAVSAQYERSETFTDGKIQAVMTAATGGYAHLDIRKSSTSYYALFADNGGYYAAGRLVISKYPAGTDLGYVDGAWVSGDTVAFEAVGSELRAVVNGEVRLRVTDTSYASGNTAIGINASAVNQGVIMDDLLIQSYATTGERVVVSESASKTVASGVSASDTASVADSASKSEAVVDKSASDTATVADSAALMWTITPITGTPGSAPTQYGTRQTVQTGDVQNAPEGFVECDSGKLIFGYNPSAAHAGSGSVAIRTATNEAAANAGTFSSPTTLLAEDSSYYYGFAGLTKIREGAHAGRVWLAAAKATLPQGTHLSMLFMYSDDEGATWSSPILPADIFTGWLNVTAAPIWEIPGTSGQHLVIGLQGTTSPETLYSWCKLLESTDGGATWAAGSTIQSFTANTVYGEPNITAVTLANGSVQHLCVYNAWESIGGTHTILARTSTDGCATWSSPTTLLTGYGGAPAIIQATDGAVMLLTRSTVADPNRTYWARSTDYGATFTVLGLLEATGNMRYGQWQNLASGRLGLCYGTETNNGLSAAVYWKTFTVNPATVGRGQDTITVSDSAAVTVGVGAITKTASDGFNVTDTSGGLAVTVNIRPTGASDLAIEGFTVADASTTTTTLVGVSASDVFYFTDASGTGVPSINRRPYWWLHRKRVSS